jgi:hypothetical protein
MVQVWPKKIPRLSSSPVNNPPLSYPPVVNPPLNNLQQLRLQLNPMSPKR